MTPRGEPVKLSRERWEMLRGSWEWPIVGMYSDGSPFMTVTEPREIDGVIFLPAEYVPGGAERVARVQKLSAAPCA